MYLELLQRIGGLWMLNERPCLLTLHLHDLRVLASLDNLHRFLLFPTQLTHPIEVVIRTLANVLEVKTTRSPTGFLHLEKTWNPQKKTHSRCFVKALSLPFLPISSSPCEVRAFSQGQWSNNFWSKSGAAPGRQHGRHPQTVHLHFFCEFSVSKKV